MHTVERECDSICITHYQAPHPMPVHKYTSSKIEAALSKRETDREIHRERSRTLCFSYVHSVYIHRFILIGHMIEAQQFVLAVVPVPDHDDFIYYFIYIIPQFLGQVMAKTKIKSKTLISLYLL